MGDFRTAWDLVYGPTTAEDLLLVEGDGWEVVLEAYREAE